MIKKTIAYSFILVIAMGCSNQQDDSKELETTENAGVENTEAPEENLTDSNPVEEVVTVPSIEDEIEKKDYEEFYESGKLKIEGNFDENGERHGLWYSYYESGIKWSESYYVHGIKSGHSITFFPNGKVRYVGEYKDDKQTGNWRFYDEEGNLTKEEDY